MMRCFGMCIFDPRRSLKQSRAVFKNKWLMEGLSVKNKILLKFSSDVNHTAINNYPEAPDHMFFFLCWLLISLTDPPQFLCILY